MRMLTRMPDRNAHVNALRQEVVMPRMLRQQMQQKKNQKTQRKVGKRLKLMPSQQMTKLQ